MKILVGNKIKVHRVKKDDKYMQYRQPDFIIIGSQKSGTTAFYFALTQHPFIQAAARKEIHYFDKRYSKGLNWYRAFFPPTGLFPEVSSGETSPYYLFHPLVPERLLKTFPHIKLFVLLRNPVDRAWSQYHHNLRRKREPLSFEQAIAAETQRLKGEAEKIVNDPGYNSFNHKHCSYLARGRYIEQLERWLSFFPGDRFMIIKSEEFFNSPASVLQDAFSFLGKENHPVNDIQNLSAGTYPPMWPETRSKLVDYFKPWNKRLYDFLGRDFGWERESEPGSLAVNT